MKVSVYIAISLDGYIARENGDLDWLPGSSGDVDPEMSGEDYGYHAFIESIDMLVMGRGTFEKVLSFGPWPYGDKRVVVLSNSMKKLPADLPETVELRSGSAQEIYEALKGSGVKHIYLDGGKTIQGFIDAGLVSEMIITTIPVLIGRGIPLFGPLSRDRRLNHLETQSFKSGLVQSKYAVIS